MSPAEKGQQLVELRATIHRGLSCVITSSSRPISTLTFASINSAKVDRDLVGGSMLLCLNPRGLIGVDTPTSCREPKEECELLYIDATSPDEVSRHLSIHVVVIPS
jgi:hypothetical protein